jgi:hypothetical protein
MFAGGEEQRISGKLLTLVKPDSQITGLYAPDGTAAQKDRASRFCRLKQPGVESPPRQAGGGVGKSGFHYPASGNEPKPVNGPGADGFRVDAKPPQRRQRIPAEESAAHHVAVRQCCVRSAQGDVLLGRA